MTEPVLTIRDLRVGFDTRRGLYQAVDGVSLSLNRGKILGLVGESGSGKSVITRTILGLLRSSGELKISGEINYQGKNLLDLDEPSLRAVRGSEIAIVLQDPMSSLNPVMTIGAQITEVMKVHLGLSGDAANKRAAELLRKVGLPSSENQLKRYPHQLSGGMRQRVAIAIGLACEPSILIADEPTTALDATVQAQILDLLREIQVDTKMTVLLISHDLGVVKEYCDEIAVIYAGKIVERFPEPGFLQSPLAPYTEALLKSQPDPEAASHTPLYTIPGLPPQLNNLPNGCRFEPRCPYAQDKCRKESPPLTTIVDTDRAYACWYPLGNTEDMA